MHFDQLMSLVGTLPWFDLATVIQLTGERRATVTNQMHRFGKAGKVVGLRRGMYVLGERYRRTAVQPAELAGAIYGPSYLSCAWALAYYGIIPESVSVFTSVTSRTPRRFANPFGEYVYRNVKQSLFFGSVPVGLDGRKVMVASPEKALIDLWHLTPGEWTVPRMEAMRFTSDGMVNSAALSTMVGTLKMPRLHRALAAWTAATADEAVGEVEL